MGFISKLGFRTRQHLGTFLTVVFSGQLVYAAFESLKIPFYEPLRQLLGLTNEEFGTMYTMLGVALFFYLPGGWVNNRLNTRTVLFWGLTYRVVTGLIMVLFLPPYPVLLALALTWGMLDGIFWPAVVKGVALFAGAGNKGAGFGLLGGLRAGGEACLNALLIVAMTLTHGSLFTLRVGMGIYACLGIVVMVLLRRYLPDDAQAGRLSGEETGAEESQRLSGRESLAGLWAVVRRLDMWLAGLAGLCIYWVYTTFLYVTPYLQHVYEASQSFASAFSVVAVVCIGLTSGVVAGIVADKIFKSASLMLAVAMTLDGVLLLLMRQMPVGGENFWIGVAGMSLMATFTFMAKTIQQAPVTELGLPANILGSAMSVNSFFGFAALLWALKLSGSILDKYGDASVAQADKAFDEIFLIIAVVAFVAAGLAGALEILKRRRAAAA